MKRCMILIMAVLLLAACGKKEQETSQAPETAAAAVLPGRDDGQGASFTLMVYMIGSDLESMDGAASSDLQEMLAVPESSGLSIVLQTGGCTDWKIPKIRGGDTQRFLLQSGGLKELESLGARKMSDGDELCDFIRWAAETCPADRYGLVLWDHGGSTIMGYGLDEYYPGEMMSLERLYGGVESAGVRFSFIGFDACMMAGLETAVYLSQVADYLIASEEIEPGTGWSYTRWLTALAGDPAADVEALARIITDDFLEGRETNPYDYYTMSVIDLAKSRTLMHAWQEWLAAVRTEMRSAYASVLMARSEARGVGFGSYDQVDLLDFMARADLESGAAEAEKVRKAFEDTVLYRASSEADINGLSVYFPYEYPELYSPVMRSLGLYYEPSYFAAFSELLNIRVASSKRAEAAAGGLEENQGMLRSRVPDVESEDWYQPVDGDLMAIDPAHLDMEDLFLGHIPLTDEERMLLTEIRLVHCIEHNGYVYEISSTTDGYDPHNIYQQLYLGEEHMFTRMFFNGHLVPMYTAEQVFDPDSGENVQRYVIPALMDGKKIQIVTAFNDDEFGSEYKVLGYRFQESCPPLSALTGTPGAPPVPDRGLRQLEDGSVLYPYFMRIPWDDFDKKGAVWETWTLPSPVFYMKDDYSIVRDTPGSNANTLWYGIFYDYEEGEYDYDGYDAQDGYTRPDPGIYDEAFYEDLDFSGLLEAGEERDGYVFLFTDIYDNIYKTLMRYESRPVRMLPDDVSPWTGTYGDL